MRANGRFLTIAASVVVTGAVWSVVAYSQAAEPRTVWDGVYSAAQAERGAQLFMEQCSTCHGIEMKGGPGAPGLTGPEFDFSWDKKPLGALFDYARMFMPPGQSGVLSDEKYADILAVLLKGNGFPVSEAAELPSTKVALDAITILMTKP